MQSADGRRLLDGVNLELRAGEIVAIAGVAGNGQQALAELLFGLHALSSGPPGAAGPRDAGARGATGCAPASPASPKTAMRWAWSATCRCGRTRCWSA